MRAMPENLRLWTMGDVVTYSRMTLIQLRATRAESGWRFGWNLAVLWVALTFGVGPAVPVALCGFVSYACAAALADLVRADAYRAWARSVNSWPEMRSVRERWGDVKAAFGGEVSRALRESGALLEWR